MHTVLRKVQTRRKPILILVTKCQKEANGLSGMMVFANSGINHPINCTFKVVGPRSPHLLRQGVVNWSLLRDLCIYTPSERAIARADVVQRVHRSHVVPFCVHSLPCATDQTHHACLHGSRSRLGIDLIVTVCTLSSNHSSHQPTPMGTSSGQQSHSLWMSHR